MTREGGLSGPPFPVGGFPMRMRFTGEYTNDRTTITYLDCTFDGHEAREVSDEVAALLDGHPEFEVMPAKRGRPRKAD